MCGHAHFERAVRAILALRVVGKRRAAMNRLYIIAVGGLVSIGVLGFEKASAQSPWMGGMRARNFQGGAVRGFGPSVGGLGARNLRDFGPTMGGMGARN